MIIDATHDPHVLEALGAQRITEVYDRDEGNSERVIVGYDVTPELDLSGYAAAAATHAGPVKRVFGFLEFVGLFTAGEQTAIMLSTDPQVRLFCLMAAGHGSVNLDDPRTNAGLDLLVSKTLLTSARRAAVKAGALPA